MQSQASSLHHSCTRTLSELQSLRLPETDRESLSRITAHARELLAHRNHKKREQGGALCQVLSDLYLPPLHTHETTKSLCVDACKLALLGESTDAQQYGLSLLARMRPTEPLTFRVLTLIAADDRRPLPLRIYAQSILAAESLSIVPQYVFDLCITIASSADRNDRASAERLLSAHLQGPPGARLIGRLGELLRELSRESTLHHVSSKILGEAKDPQTTIEACFPFLTPERIASTKMILKEYQQDPRSFALVAPETFTLLQRLFTSLSSVQSFESVLETTVIALPRIQASYGFELFSTIKNSQRPEQERLYALRTMERFTAQDGEMFIQPLFALATDLSIIDTPIGRAAEHAYYILAQKVHALKPRASSLKK